MSAIGAAIAAQFKHPTGALGAFAGAVMAARPSNRRRNRWTLALAAIRPTDHVFELGCGPGYALALAAESAAAGFVTGVDHSATMIAMARGRVARALRAGRCNLIIGDDRQLCIHDRSLDVVYSANVVQFLPDLPLYFRRAHASLKRGGRMASTYQPRGANPSAAKAEAMAEECAAAARAAGFADVRVETLALRRAPAICVLALK